MVQGGSREAPVPPNESITTPRFDFTDLQEQLGDPNRTGNEANDMRAGRLIVLPSTHIGGDRYMRHQMQDIISMSNKLGHPHIFLTVTCNPNWP